MPSSILNHPLISERYFFPRRQSFTDPFWVSAGDVRLACHYHEVDPGGLTIVHFHGNGEIVPDYIAFLPELFGRFGCNTLLSEFRGYGMSEGHPELGRILDDTASIIEQSPAPVGKTVLFGRSVGSIPAIHAASLFPDVAGMIIESGIADVLERLLLRVDPEEMNTSMDKLKQEVATRLDQTGKLSSFSKPLLIMHTANDGLVDVAHAEKLYAAAGTPEKKLEIFPRGDHNSIMAVNAESYFKLIGNFLQNL